MKNKIFVVAFLLTVAIVIFVSQAFTADWSQYESGRDNIRLDGYQGQPGYVRFTDGDGNTTGYLFCRTASQGLKFVTAGGIDLTTTKLSESTHGAMLKNFP